MENQPFIDGNICKLCSFKAKHQKSLKSHTQSKKHKKKYEVYIKDLTELNSTIFGSEFC